MAVEVIGWVTKFVGGEGSGRCVFDEPRYAGATVRSVLRGLTSKFPELERALWHGGELGEHIEVLVNDAVLGIAHSLDSTLEDGDRIALIGQFMGGRAARGDAIMLSQVDAFTDARFSGNAAAVCLLPESRPTSWLQAVAAEMNLSETAFLVPGPTAFGLRWFTPAVEVDLCGHATLASAHVLWEAGVLPPAQEARFDTLAGILTARQQNGWIEMTFPGEPERPASAPVALAEGLGVVPRYVGRNRLDWLVEVESETQVRDLHPDLGRLAGVEGRGVIVTARSETHGYHFVSRFFAPRVGIPEDPVTGSAHCCLGPFWSERLALPEVVGYQASARGGVVRVRVDGEKVHLAGQAVTVFRGTLIA